MDHPATVKWWSDRGPFRLQLYIKASRRDDTLWTQVQPCDKKFTVDTAAVSPTARTAQVAGATGGPLSAPSLGLAEAYSLMNTF
jgi:hypothetical protein